MTNKGHICYSWGENPEEGIKSILEKIFKCIPVTATITSINYIKSGKLYPFRRPETLEEDIKNGMTGIKICYEEPNKNEHHDTK